MALIGTPSRRSLPASRSTTFAVPSSVRRTALADPEAITRRLVARFVDLGGRLRTRTAVEDVVRGTDTVVVACGSETPAILARLAARGHCGELPTLPIRPLVRSLVETDAVASPPRLPLVIEAHDGFHFRTRGDGLRLAMADDPPRWTDSTDPRARSPRGLRDHPLARVKRRFPAAATAEIVRRWAGLYDVTPDARPIVDRLDARVFVAAGWSGHGFMTSPAVGRALADWVAMGTRPAVFEGFVAARFASAIPDVWPTLL
jgi:sarcosine oxidase subunit beta